MPKDKVFNVLEKGPIYFEKLPEGLVEKVNGFQKTPVTIKADSDNRVSADASIDFNRDGKKDLFVLLDEKQVEKRLWTLAIRGEGWRFDIDGLRLMAAAMVKMVGVGHFNKEEIKVDKFIRGKDDYLDVVVELEKGGYYVFFGTPGQKAGELREQW